MICQLVPSDSRVSAPLALEAFTRTPVAPAVPSMVEVVVFTVTAAEADATCFTT